MPTEGHYSEQEAEEILRIAANQTGGGIDRRRLVDMAAELGISPEAVQAAEEELKRRKHAEELAAEEQRLWKEFRAMKRRDFGGHLGGYAFTNAFLLGIWYFTGANYFWPGWVLAGWGLGLLADFVTSFLGLGDQQAEFKKWRRKQARARKRERGQTAESLETVIEEIASQDLEEEEAVDELRIRLSLSIGDAKTEIEEYARKHPGVFRIKL